MIEGLKKNTSALAMAVAAGFLFTSAAALPAKAADLGGDCCADLEERIAELEVTTVRKGNRKVSVQLYGAVTRALMIWDTNYVDDNGNAASASDQYVVGVPYSGISRFGLKGGAKIGHGWSAGFKLEWGVNDTLSSAVDQNDDDSRGDAEGLGLRQEYVYLKNDRLGSVAIGHASTATDGIAEIDLSGTKDFVRSGVEGWNSSFDVVEANVLQWGDFVTNLDGGRGDVIRYDSPKLHGVIASFAWGEDDYWDVALRYAGEFGGVIKVAAGIGYQYNSDDTRTLTGLQNALGVNPTLLTEDETISGSVSGLHIPTGLFVTFAAGERNRDFVGVPASYDTTYWWVKSGLRRKFTHMGDTIFYGEYGQYNNTLSIANDSFDIDAELWGLGVAQNIDAAAMQIFAAYRNYELDVPGDFDFRAFMLGASIKF